LLTLSSDIPVSNGANFKNDTKKICNLKITGDEKFVQFPDNICSIRVAPIFYLLHGGRPGPLRRWRPSAVEPCRRSVAESVSIAAATWSAISGVSTSSAAADAAAATPFVSGYAPSAVLFGIIIVVIVRIVRIYNPLNWILRKQEKN
jgi:hypothetical protein